MKMFPAESEATLWTKPSGASAGGIGASSGKVHFVPANPTMMFWLQPAGRNAESSRIGTKAFMEPG